VGRNQNAFYWPSVLCPIFKPFSHGAKLLAYQPLRLHHDHHHNKSRRHSQNLLRNRHHQQQQQQQPQCSVEGYALGHAKTRTSSALFGSERITASKQSRILSWGACSKWRMPEFCLSCYERQMVGPIQFWWTSCRKRMKITMIMPVGGGPFIACPASCVACPIVRWSMCYMNRLWKPLNLAVYAIIMDAWALACSMFSFGSATWFFFPRRSYEKIDVPTNQLPMGIMADTNGKSPRWVVGINGMLYFMPSISHDNHSLWWWCSYYNIILNSHALYHNHFFGCRFWAPTKFYRCLDCSNSHWKGEILSFSYRL